MKEGNTLILAPLNVLVWKMEACSIAAPAAIIAGPTVGQKIPDDNDRFNKTRYVPSCLTRLAGWLTVYLYTIH